MKLASGKIYLDYVSIEGELLTATFHKTFEHVKSVSQRGKATLTRKDH